MFGYGIWLMNSQEADDGGVNQSKFCWKCGVQILLEICVQTHKTWSSHKNSWKCMHLLSLISIDSSFDRILNTKF